ncbi:MAG TPA: hypothetical protein VEJ84_22740, partial [Acidimicrobiales bacterium]|nr:hypothetical protein [Acidimicrobiales bacterium]
RGSAPAVLMAAVLPVVVLAGALLATPGVNALAGPTGRALDQDQLPGPGVPTSTTPILDYQYYLVVRSQGTGQDFVPAQSEDTAETTPESYDDYSGSASARWSLVFYADFTVDKKRRTVDAEGSGASGAYGEGTLVGEATPGEKSTESFRLTATGNHGPTSCVVPPGTKFLPTGTLHDLWGGGPDPDIFRGGLIGLFLSASAQTAPTFECTAEKGEPQPFGIGPETVPGFTGTGEGRLPGCAAGQAELDKYPQPVLEVPVRYLGQDHIALNFDYTFTCVGTLLDAVFTAHVTYFVDLSLLTVNGQTERALVSAYDKDIQAALTGLDAVLQVVRAGSPNNNDIRVDLHAALGTLGQIDTFLLPEPASHDIALALGWLHDASAAHTLPEVESSTARAAQELRYTEQVM